MAWDAAATHLAPLTQVETVQFPPLDLVAIAELDALREAEGQPYRFAIPHEVAVEPHKDGTWEQVGERSIWRYRVQAEGATSLNFGFTHYRLPPSARLYVYDSGQRLLAGPWDERKNQPHGQLWTPVITSADVVIELNVDRREKDRVELLLGRINQGYRGLGGPDSGYVPSRIGKPEGADSDCSISGILSGSCNMDVACLGEDDPWNDPRRSVGAITRSGVDTCTGSLLNNTANDRRALFATATHCGLTAATAPSVVVYWNYEWPTCRTPGTPASGQVNSPDPSMASSGTSFVAATPNPFSSASCQTGMETTCTDWTLLEIDDPIDPDWNLYWAGWDRRTAGALCSKPSDPTSTSGLCASIHHPGVDEKRISFVPYSLTTSGISRGINTHWHAAWDPSPPILPNIVNPPSVLPPNVTEGGSSGSPLYSAEQRVVGVLSGGYSYCGATGSDLSDDYGQLAIAWEGRGTPATRMKDHLDPLGTGAEFIDGIGTSPFGIDLQPASLDVCSSTTATGSVTVDVSAEPGVVASVALSATDIPTGAFVSFDPASVAAPGSSTLTLDGLDNVAEGSHTLRVVGSSGADVATKPLLLNVASDVPQAAMLQAPTNGSIDVSTGPELVWSAPGGGAVDYLVEIATDAAFTDIVFSRTVSNATSVNVTPALAPMTTHYWRVTSSNACAAGVSSAVHSFTTGITFPEPYCEVNFPNAVEPITLVRFSGIDNRSPATINGSPAHEDFLGVAGGVVVPGGSYPMVVEGNTDGPYTTVVNAYIDWNRNGVFDANEAYVIGNITASTGEDGKQATSQILVPADATPGPVRMRVLKKYSSAAPACNTDGWGQAEDYTLMVSTGIFADGFESASP